MDWHDFAGKKVAILGAGMENLSLLPLLERAGALVTICEQDDLPVFNDLKLQYPNLKLVIGQDHLESLSDYDVLVRSPGLPVSRVNDSLVRDPKGVIRTSVTDLFLSVTNSKVIGVTGTKGKGTTSTLIGEILSAAGEKVVVAGNIGKPIFDIYDQLTPEHLVVLELSSFQLEDISHSPDIAVLLPITEDHLKPLSERSPNFHRTIDDYVAAKAKIVAFQTPNDLVVFSSDSPSASGLASNANSRRLSVGRTESSDFRYDEEGNFYSGSEILLNFKTLGLIGAHTYLDASLATALALDLGVDLASIQLGIRNFKPLPHRLQPIGKYDGVNFIDDSCATAPDAAIAAIRSFDGPMIWIGGGSSKGADFSELALNLKNGRTKVAILLGEEKDRIAETLEVQHVSFSVIKVDSLQEAVEKAKSHATSGDVVLFSPACAGKDMFKSAYDRGEQFTQLATNRNG